MIATVTDVEVSVLYRLLSIGGIFVFIALAWVLSVDRKNVSWKTVGWGIALQFIFAAVVLNPAVQAPLFKIVNGGVDQLLFFAEEGGKFIFGPIPDSSQEGKLLFENLQMINVFAAGSLEALKAEGTITEQEFALLMGSTPDAINAQAQVWLNSGSIDQAKYELLTTTTVPNSNAMAVGSYHPANRNVAFFIIMPTIIFFSSLMAILYQLGVMDRIVRVIALAMQKTMGTTGPESLSAAANIFVGQTEAPLVVKPYVEKMHKSELHAVMTGGFATVAGGVLATYVGMLAMKLPNIAGHLVAASIISAPAALAISKVMWPMPKDAMEQAEVNLQESTTKPYGNLVEAAAIGAKEGMTLVLNVLAMLIAFVGLVALVNWGLGFISLGGADLTLERILGWVFSPLAFCMGIPWNEAAMVGELLGQKLVLTEFIAYENLSKITNDPNQEISRRSALIASYALCGFANFASIGIQIGGIGAIAPSRIKDLAAMGIRAMIGGTLAAFMTATIAGVLLS